MNMDLDVRRPDANMSLGQALAGAAPTASPQAAGDPLQVVHRALRGRYLLAFVLAVMGAAVGGYLGMRISPPEYHSEGILHIAYALPSVSTTIPQQNMPMTIFEGFLRAQQLHLTSRSVVEQAVKDPIWKSVAHGPEAGSIRSFAGALTVDHPNGTDELHITFADIDPKVAAAGVKAIINAYSRDYETQEADFQAKLLTALTEQGAELSARLQELQSQMGGEASSTDLQPEIDAVVAREALLEQKLNSARELVAMGIDPANPPTDPARIIQMIGTSDPEMRQLVAERQRLQDELDLLKARGYMEDHLSVQDTEQSLQQVNQHIVDYAARISAGVDALTQEYQQVHEQLQQLSGQKMKGDALKSWVEQVGKDMAEVTAQSDALRLGGRAGSRLTVENTSGDEPIFPFNQKHRLMMAAAGAGALGLLPVAVLVLLGLRTNQLRTSHDTNDALTAGVPLLGVLPSLNRMDDPTSDAGAAHCIHQMRVMLQVGVPRDHHPIYMMTSAAPGEGKTSLTNALGLSYAMSGSRTLVVDADLVGRGLTAAFDADGRPGFYEAMLEGTINGYARPTATRGLWVLSAGQGNGDEASQLSSVPVRRLLADIRKHFDVILIDSGPILGSVEASVICQDVDKVIFVVSKGQQVPLVKRAIAQLRSVKASLAGMVFNRADAREFSKNGYASSMHTRRWQGASQGVWPGTGGRGSSANGEENFDEALELGPLARSVNTAPQNPSN